MPSSNPGGRLGAAGDLLRVAAVLGVGLVLFLLVVLTLLTLVSMPNGDDADGSAVDSDGEASDSAGSSPAGPALADPGLVPPTDASFDGVTCAPESGTPAGFVISVDLDTGAPRAVAVDLVTDDGVRTPRVVIIDPSTSATRVPDSADGIGACIVTAVERDRQITYSGR